MDWLNKNRTRLIMLAILTVLLVMAIRGMETGDWVITALRGLSVGALTFLVAAGLSIIFGLMDVLNFAHGELYMIGAYVAWTMYVRPDTVIDGLTPFALIAAALVMLPLWREGLSKLKLPARVSQIWPWVALIAGGVLVIWGIIHYPISKWSTQDYATSPITYSVALDNGMLTLPEAVPFGDVSPVLLFAAIIGGSLLLGFALAGFGLSRTTHLRLSASERRNTLLLGGGLTIAAFVVLAANTPLSAFLFSLTTTWKFFIAVIVSTGTGVILGAIIEMLLIRPLYNRPMYQLMMTLGLGFIGVEVVQAMWGKTGFNVPRPALFAGTGDPCPATNLADLWNYHCSTAIVFDGRIRAYNEIFIIAVGIVVLVAVWLLLQRTRMGMIIRAGVQDSDMVEALGINVRRVFTLVFALGVGLAALGGALAGPALGLSNDMGMSVLLLALIALAIGGLTSFPGAAAGAVLVGLMQQFITKYGQIGIKLPFIAEPFKPSPPIVPASTILLMVIVLLVLPQGLFGRRD